MQYGGNLAKAGAVSRTVLWSAASGLLALGLGGCHHRRVALRPLPPISQPVELVQLPLPYPPPLVEPEQVDLSDVPMLSGPFPRRERRRRPQPVANNSTSTPAPVEETPSSSTSTEDAAIGSLSLGGDASPQAQREAEELIASIEHRLDSLPSRRLTTDRAQISRIRNFRKKAQEALHSGDVAGAKTLATKARLLLDDLQK